MLLQVRNYLISFIVKSSVQIDAIRKFHRVTTMHTLSPRKKASFLELAEKGQRARKKIFLLEFFILLASAAIVVGAPPGNTHDAFPDVIPPAIFEHQGKIYASCEYAYTAFYIPIDEILDMAQQILDASNNVTAQFTHHHPDLEEVKKELQSLIQSVRVEMRVFGGQSNSTRARRSSLNWNVNLDIVGAVNGIFNGLNNLVHAPSLRKLQEQQKHLAANTKNIIKVLNGTLKVTRFLEQRQINTSYQVNELSENQRRMNEKVRNLNIKFEDFKYSELLKSKLNQAIDILKDVSSAAADMAKGHLPASLFHPKEAREFYLQAQFYADTNGKELAITTPLEIYNIPISVHARADYWFFVIAFPLVDPTEQFDLHRFINTPFFLSPNSTVQFEEPEEVLVATQDGLSQDFKYFLGNPHKCKKYSNKMSLCHGMKVQRGINGTCIPSLLSKAKIQPTCALKDFEAESWGPVEVGKKLVMFFQEEKDLLLKYANGTKVPKTVPKGRFIMDKINGLTISTDDWEYKITLFTTLKVEEIMEVELSSHIASFEMPTQTITSSWNKSHYVTKDDFDNQMSESLNQIDSLQDDLDDVRSNPVEDDEDEVDETPFTFVGFCLSILGFVMICGVIWYLLKSKYAYTTWCCFRPQVGNQEQH